MGAYFHCEHVPARTRTYVDIEKAPNPPVSSQTQTTQQLTNFAKLPKMGGWEDQNGVSPGSWLPSLPSVSLTTTRASPFSSTKSRASRINLMSSHHITFDCFE